MTAFVKTWEHPTTPTDFVGKRALDAIETNSALMLMCSKNDDAYWGILQNLSVRSSEFDNAAWTKGAVTVTANTGDTTDPLGGSTADKIIETATTAEHLIHQGQNQAAIRMQAGITYTGSVYLKQGSSRYVILRTGAGAFALEGYVIDLQTGTPTSIGAFPLTRAEVVSIGNGWYRCAITATCTITSNASSPFSITFSNSAAPSVPNPSYLGSTANNIYTWGYQVETKTRMGTYQATTTAAVSGGLADWNNTISTTTRAANTTFTNSTGKNMLIVVSVNLLSTATALAAGGVPTANMQVKETTDGALFTVSNISVPAAPILGLANTDETYNVYGVVGPGGTYRCNTNAPTNSTATIVSWYEMTFDACHTPQTWTQGEYVNDIRRVNRYARGVSAHTDKDGAITRATSNAANPSTGSTIISRTRFFAIKHGDTVAGTIAVYDTDRSTGTAMQSKTASTTTVTTMSGLHNAYGGITCAGIPTPAGTPLHEFFTLPISSSINFASGDIGAGVETKFKDLDTQASVGGNTTERFSRTNHGTGTASLSRTGGFYFTIANVTFTPTALALASCEVNAGGGNTGQAYGEVPSALAPRAGLIMSFLVIQQSGSGVSFTAVESTVGTRYSWMIT